jgi:hypothetical protein
MSESSRADERVVEVARELIRIPSLTPVSADLRPASRQNLAYLRQFLVAAGAHCEWLSFEGDHGLWGYPVDNLYAEWGTAWTGPKLCFIGHTDVVPPGDASAWSKDPFAGTIENGLLYGRGATEMKGAVAAFAVAAAEFAKEQSAAGSPLSVGLLITTDEEWAAVNGTRRSASTASIRASLQRFEKGDQVLDLIRLEAKLRHAWMACGNALAERFFEALDWIPFMKFPKGRRNCQWAWTDPVDRMALSTICAGKHHAALNSRR